jgi:hypothetical protein
VHKVIPCIISANLEFEPAILKSQVGSGYRRVLPHRIDKIPLILPWSAQGASTIFLWKSITLMYLYYDKTQYNQGYPNSAAQAQIKQSRHENASIDSFVGLVPILVPEQSLFTLHDSRSSLPTFGNSISDILPSCLVGLPRQNLNFLVPPVFQYLLHSWLGSFLSF